MLSSVVDSWVKSAVNLPKLQVVVTQFPWQLDVTKPWKAIVISCLAGYTYALFVASPGVCLYKDLKVSLLFVIPADRSL